MSPNSMQDKYMSQFRNIKQVMNNKFKVVQKENEQLREDMQCMMEMQRQT
jgi:hypothetical protein